MTQVTGKNINDCKEYLEKSDLIPIYNFIGAIHLTFANVDKKTLSSMHLLRPDAPDIFYTIKNNRDNLFVVYGESPILYSDFMILKYNGKIIVGIDASNIKRKLANGEDLEEMIRNTMYSIIVFLGDKLTREELNTFVEVIIWKINEEMKIYNYKK